MAPVIETGHYKNVTSFDTMIQKALAMGASYNPAKVSIKIGSLQTLLTHAQADYAAVSPATIPYNTAVNQRIIIFQPYKSYATQILAAVKTSSDADPQLIKDLTTINRKIQGARAPKNVAEPVDPNAPAPDNISASQQSYDMKYDHWTKFTDLIASIPSYLPNEANLKIAAIQTFRTSLQNANTNVATTYEAINLARIQRDKTLYKDGTGVYSIQDLVKEYVKGAFGAKSIQYKQMVAIKFTKPKKLFI